MTKKKKYKTKQNPQTLLLLLLFLQVRGQGYWKYSDVHTESVGHNQH